MPISINPGSGPVSDATESHAITNMGAFVADLCAQGLQATGFSRQPSADYGDGRYAFDVTFAARRSVQVQMPGLPTDRVRYLDAPGQNIWDFPRLYIDDSSWVWMFALRACESDDEYED